ncbi:LuxR C-terminal-related transcriptional regulator [Streptomyces sp. CS131]|uniref:helix-turn-helix transcriptional regulator n=1 Tax=Streptomyces sp. CS131 TaxID=2162711 RepID=UPI000D506C2D|nr:LuxR C-terminal-related transcriptional regulator [Streptomyces sp. CS131]PVC84408.1 helix-turn-helix transcriptional regulator [Streptomyces sp. CS131]
MCTEDDAHAVPHPPHPPEELCAPALGLYSEALRRGYVPEQDATRAPCLAPLGLLRPDPYDTARLLPVPAAAALTRLLTPITHDIRERLAASAAVVDALIPLAAITDSAPDTAITRLDGKSTIQASIKEAADRAEEHILTLHPGSKRPEKMLEQARARAIEPLRRGVAMRHLYQHSARYGPNLKRYVDRLPYENLQIRTMEQTAERMFILDRTAYISISPQRDAALRITHPALVRHLIHVYDILWAGATPFGESLRTAPPGTPFTAVQLSIARLLTEGHVDDVVARKMGISVRTCRAHIAKLMQSLGATSRTHLGALIVRSGISELPNSPAACENSVRQP